MLYIGSKFMVVFIDKQPFKCHHVTHCLFVVLPDRVSFLLLFEAMLFSEFFPLRTKTDRLSFWKTFHLFTQEASLVLTDCWKKQL